MFKQALEIKENAYGPDHPSVAKVYGLNVQSSLTY